MDIVSLVVGLVSIGLAIYSIWFANKESRQSSDNYSKTKELLKEIEHKAELIDRTVQMEQKLSFDVVNKLLEIVGKPKIDAQPLTMLDIDAAIAKKDNEIDRRIENVVKQIPTIRVEGSTLIIETEESKKGPLSGA